MKLDTENTQLPAPILTALKKEIVKLESGLSPESQIEVYVDISGDHLYHLKGEVTLNGEAIHIVHSQHPDIEKAIEKFVASLKKLTQTKAGN